MTDSDKTDALVHLAGTMAHELNNIFTVVTGNLSLLETATDRDQGADLVQDVMRTAHRGIELSRQLQAFAGRQKLRRTAFDINHGVSSALAMLGRDLLRGIDVELDLLPAACMVAADQEQFGQLVEELARNAAAAMNQRGWLIVGTSHELLSQGQVRSLPAGPYARLCMRDSGPGMTPDVMRRALDPLFSTKSGHRGWGLARIAGFLRQSGGDIMLSSVKGQGTTVEVYLPRMTR